MGEGRGAGSQHALTARGAGRQLLLDDAARQCFYLLQGDYTAKLLDFIDRRELPSTLGGELDVAAWLLEQRRLAAAPGGDGVRREAEAELRRRQVGLADRQLADLEQSLGTDAGGGLEYGGRAATEGAWGARARAQARARTQTRTQTHAGAHTNARTRARAHSRAHARTRTRTRTHTHTHTRTHTHTHTHTYTHTINHKPAL